ncbi:Aste57867_8647 [Aphanomyces stellatus]|uniref:Aste57867_8647 protein n=1 Tax=Aphanomyces stellatus TaxID=120398 RepID=A0A485KKT1_9STRA|nr:hypothetical protein As57867_008613 [Aphanomyces stellatus]VFT85533.1 Aste57867_8647 [Aphanomyces stellatus]
MALLDKVKYVWGANQSLGFRVGSWALAGGLAVSAYVLTRPPSNAEFTDADSWNKQVLAKKELKKGP